MRPPKSRPNRSHRKMSYSISNIGNMMGCDHQSCVPVGPFAGELWHFEYFPTTPSAKLPTFNIWSRDCHCGPNLLLYTKFHQNWFTRSACRRPYAVARQRPLPWQPHHGRHVGNMTGCDHPHFVPIGPLGGELWYFQYFLTWRPAAILNFINFNIWSRDCYCGPNLLLCTKFHQN